jgi:biopolymer transport protein ExbD
VRLSSGRPPDDPEINLVSLIDVVFCLIIFLVVTTSFNQRSAIKLQLPRADVAAEPAEAEPLTIVIDADGRYFIGNQEVLKRDAASLKEAIARVAGDDRNRAVVLRADARSQTQSVITAMEVLGQLGFTRVSLPVAPGNRP